MSFTVEPVDAAGARPSRTSKQLLALIAVLVGAFLFAGGLTAASGGMRHVIVENGGSCGSGGPYEISSGHQCDSGSAGLLMGGIAALLVGGGILLAGSAAYGGWQGTGVIGVLWGALFGVLGFNFIQFGLDPPDSFAGNGAAVGLLFPGVVFWLMALPGLFAPLLLLRWRGQDRTKKDSAAVTAPTIVRANVPEQLREQVPGIPGFRAGDTPEPAAPPMAPWLVGAAAGTAGGVLAGLAWISAAF